LAVRALTRASPADKLQALDGDLADPDSLRQMLAFQPRWTWQQTVAASVALASDGQVTVSV
jgi:anti-sigma factor ChrR (cupin superfamily)